MQIDSKILIKNFGKNIFFKEKLSKYSWFNLGGPAKIFFKPESDLEIIKFLKIIKKDIPIKCLGAGSNTLIRDGGYNGVIIKLSPKFSFIKKDEKNILEVGAATLDKKLSNYALENSLSGFEFLSCIPGSVGGAIIMNSGCYANEISQILLSVKTLDRNGNLKVINSDEIKFMYRGTNLPEDLIILSAKFRYNKDEKRKIKEKIDAFIELKKKTQPSQIKTCGSTFKNPHNKKAWKLIKESNCENLSFGGASISKKHNNFFVNNGDATSDDIEKLINVVKEKVYNKKNIKLDLEIKLIGDQKNNA